MTEVLRCLASAGRKLAGSGLGTDGRSRGSPWAILGETRELARRLLDEGPGQFSVTPSSRVTVANDDVNGAECSGAEPQEVLPQVYYPVTFIQVEFLFVHPSEGKAVLVSKVGIAGVLG